MGQPGAVREGFLGEKAGFKSGLPARASERLSTSTAARPWEGSQCPVSLSLLICIMGTRLLGGREGGHTGSSQTQRPGASRALSHDSRDTQGPSVPPFSWAQLGRLKRASVGGRLTLPGRGERTLPGARPELTGGCQLIPEASRASGAQEEKPGQDGLTGERGTWRGYAQDRMCWPPPAHTALHSCCPVAVGIFSPLCLYPSCSPSPQRPSPPSQAVLASAGLPERLPAQRGR